MTRVNESAHKTVTACESLMECMYGSEEYILYMIFKLAYSAAMLPSLRHTTGHRVAGMRFLIYVMYIVCVLSAI